MAYRKSHFRSGYFRRTPNGNYTWVSPTFVSGYSYCPGVPETTRNIPSIHYQNNNVPIATPIIRPNAETIEQIVRLFRSLESDERKYCLDVLESIDVELDENIKSLPVACSPDNIPISDEFDFILRFDNTLRITKYKSFEPETLYIPSQIGMYSITQIGNGVFKGCNNIKRVILEEGIQSIGKECFSCCHNLEEVIFPNSLISIDDEAFRATKIYNLTLADNIQFIGKYCFAFCRFLNTVILSRGLKELSENAFKECYNLTCFAIRENLQSIPKGVLTGIHIGRTAGIPPLEIFIPDNVTHIDNAAFGDSILDHLYMIIYCNESSYALQYARNHNFKYGSMAVRLGNNNMENKSTGHRLFKKRKSK